MNLLFYLKSDEENQITSACIKKFQLAKTVIIGL